MNMTKLVGTYAVVAAITMPLQSRSQEILTGDTRLACEAILCLATASPPGECAPSLTRYFSISLRRLGDTARARAKFLRLCPRSNQTAQMQSLLAAQPAGSEAVDAEKNASRGVAVGPVKENDK